MQEIKMAVADGAKEIDIVINRFLTAEPFSWLLLNWRTEAKSMELTNLISFRQLALEQRWTELYEEVKQMKVRIFLTQSQRWIMS